MKTRIIAALIALALAPFAAQAQSVGATLGQTSSVTGQSSASIAPGAVNITSNGAAQLPWTSVSQDFHTNQAASAPANIGSTSPGSNTGCPAVDGWSASVVIANGGKTTAQELPGCMLNILGQNIGMLKQVEVTLPGGAKAMQFDGISVMRLETWCLLPLYKKAIENGMNFKCKETRDEMERQRATAVLTQAPGVVTAQQPSGDPYIARRLGYANR